jgi:NitT/TauT family transport system substrate-binding protein
MKNKVQMMLLVVLGIILVFTGCSNAANTKNAGNTANNASGSAVSGQTENENNAVEEQPLVEKKIRVAYHPHIVGAGAMVMAEEMGYFEEVALKVDPVKFTAGPPELQAMASGDIDLGYLGVGAHVLCPKGQCVILTLDSTDISNEVLATVKSGVKEMKDLKGKTVAVPTGTTSDMVFTLALEKAGLTKDDMNVVNMDVAGAVAAFVAEKVDAVAIWAPYTTEIRKQKGDDNVIELAHSKEFLPEKVFPQSWVTTKKFAENNRDVLVRFLKAWIKGNDYRFNRMEETVKLTSEFTQVPEDSNAALVDTTYWMTSNEMKKLYEDGTALEWYNQQQDMFVGIGSLEQAVPVEEFVDFSYFMEAWEQLNQ